MTTRRATAKDGAAAVAMLDAERKAPETPAPETPAPVAPDGLRKCIGSTKFGIPTHEAPVDDFPAQPSQKDGLGRMCKPHWTEYTRALRKASLARKAAAQAVREAAPAADAPPVKAPRTKKASKAATPEPSAQGDAG